VLVTMSMRLARRRHDGRRNHVTSLVMTTCHVTASWPHLSTADRQVST